MNVINLPYGLGPRRLSQTIVAWFEKAREEKTRWTPSGLEHDLILMATHAVWTGKRRSEGGTNFTVPNLMDRLATLQAHYPTLTFFVGTFPQLKGQSRRQILWYSDTEMGTEEDLSQERREQ